MVKIQYRLVVFSKMENLEDNNCSDGEHKNEIEVEEIAETDVAIASLKQECTCDTDNETGAFGRDSTNGDGGDCGVDGDVEDIGACADLCGIEKIALQCNAESLVYSPAVHFLELPDLVVEEILKHVDKDTKLSLRLTCHATKKWVETQTFMSLFHVSINADEEMISLVQFAKLFPTTKWKKIAFLEKLFASHQSFPSFVSTFSSHITHLHIHYFNGGLAQILFLSSCETLVHLQIDEMDIRDNPSLLVASDKTLKAKCPKLLEVFTTLKTLVIGTIFFNNVKQLPFYQTFLQRCRKLEKVNVPRPQGPNTISWEAVKTIQLKSIIGPISEYLHKKPVTSPIKTDIKLLDVEGLFSRHFPTVAESCVRTGAVTLFENVNEKHVKYLFTHEGDILQRIASLKEKIDDRRPIEKWVNLQDLYVRSSRCDIRNEYPGYIAYPKLKNLTLLMDSRERDDPNFLMLQRLVKLLIMSERVNLEKFYLQWPAFSHNTPQDYIRAQDFCGNFCNLTKLHVSGWTAPDDDFLLICSVLIKLKHLILEECLNLTDYGLLGSSELLYPAIMNLRHLVRLEVRNRNNPGFLTDQCFELAFVNMRLKFLLIESFHVTKNAYENMAEGEIRYTIQKLPIPHILPRGVADQDEFKALVEMHFPNVIITST
ncbi:unnamed protein product [Orchesella dallaii]|uniref:F-box domain-containing protein n=1 Tax=Orchesella dallaii TaxID=48710 RepID=A0ABP1PPB4_9HEXA